MPQNLGFMPGSLEREIVIRGLSFEAFAQLAELDPATVARAVKGLRLKPKSYGKILSALGKIQPISGPIELVQMEQRRTA